MRTLLVMTIIGRDRPGIVEQVASLLAAHGGNWLESRMCRLGGEFAGILRADVPREARDDFAAAARQLADLTVIVREDQPAFAPALRFATMEIVGHDRPGIVREIARALAASGVNVEELETECASAPMSGEMLFKARARLALPGDCDVGLLRDNLQHIAADLLVEVNFAEEPVENQGAVGVETA